MVGPPETTYLNLDQEIKCLSGVDMSNTNIHANRSAFDSAR